MSSSGRQTIGWAVALGAGLALVSRIARAKRSIDFTRASVVIFGGSRGLGLVIARELAQQGAHLTLAARDEDEFARARADLEQHGGQVSIIQCDVRDRRQVESAIAQVIDQRGHIDVLINNAGIIQVGPLDHMTIADFETAMATHFWGPLYAISAALPHMRRRGARRIVNISSIGGKVSVPHLLPYSASKFALTGLSEGLQAELAPDGFFVTTVCPGLMRTGSSYNAWFKGQHRREFAWFHISDSMPGISIDARRAARQIIDACRHGDPELIITPAARLVARLNGVIPGTMATAMALVNRILPAAEHGTGNDMHSGWQSVSRLVPSTLTALSDRASVENNELPVGEPARP
jgi:NAD(P)-dependent dehydrogenase (short-subunit alcohol dehydrogenase family)